jgi:hypothetical protein
MIHTYCAGGNIFTNMQNKRSRFIFLLKPEISLFYYEAFSLELDMDLGDTSM